MSDLPRAFERDDLKHLDRTLRDLVDAKYEFCLSRCIETRESHTEGLPECKQSCFRKIIVPYRYYNHQSRSEEDNAYRKCIGEKMPNVTQSDFIKCSYNIYGDRF